MSIKNPWERRRALGPTNTKWITEPVRSQSPWAKTLPGSKPWSQRYVGPGAYTWQRHLMAGLRKGDQSKGYEGYYTYRTISTKSDPLSWIQRRIPPNRIFRATAQYMKPRVKAMIEAELRAMG